MPCLQRPVHSPDCTTIQPLTETMTKTFSCIHFLREVRNELGGVVTAVVDFCESMAARGHRITLLTCDAKDVPTAWKGEGRWPRVIETKTSRISSSLLSSEGKRLFEEACKDADVIHLHTPWEPNNLTLANLARRHKTPYVVTVHGMLDDWSMKQKSLKKRAYLRLFGRRLFRHATTVHFTARAEMEQALRWIPAEGRSLIQCFALDPLAYSPLPGPEPALAAFPFIRQDCRKLLFLSRIHPKKGVELLLQAAKILKSSPLKFQLLIAGPGDDAYIAQLKHLAVSLDVADVTHFLGMVRGVEKRSLFELADAFVLPTYQENFGLVLAEAMACGTAVVTTQGTDIWRELEEGGAKIVGFSPQNLADGILEVTKDSERCRSIGRQGLEFVYRWLDRDHVSAAYESMYFDAISRGSAQTSISDGELHAIPAA